MSELAPVRFMAKVVFPASEIDGVAGADPPKNSEAFNIWEAPNPNSR